MKISEVIKYLEEVLEKHGDLDVRVCADHGQVDMKVCSGDIMYSMEDERMIEGSYNSLEEFIDETGEEPNYKFVSLYAG